MTILHDIYGELDELLEPAALPAPWHHSPAPPDYRAPLPDFKAAVSLLRTKFSDEDLVSSGVFIRRRVGFAFNLHLLLGNVLLLRRSFADPPYDIVSVAGCVSGLQPPVLAALTDAATLKLLEKSGETLLATFTIQDAAILQALGFPAMPAAGLDKLSGSDFARFAKVFDVRSLSYDDCDDSASAKKAPPPSSSGSPDLPQNPPASGAPLSEHNSPGADQQSAGPSTPPEQPTLPENMQLTFVACQLAQLSWRNPKNLPRSTYTCRRQPASWTC